MLRIEKRMYIPAAAAVLLAAASLLAVMGWDRGKLTSAQGGTSGERCVVLDAGHGGDDPGKIGINGALEKDVNLAITLLVKQYLEESDIRVVMTRETSEGLYDAGASNKKVQDMKNRVGVIEKSTPDLTVSIHQNSYHEEYVHGAQTFYYQSSTNSKELAEKIQDSMILGLDPDNTRQAKPNDSYYLLKKTSSPIVIVECGFLSNYEEAQKLASDYYQEKTAWAIHLGIMQYLNSMADNKGNQ